MSQLLVGSPRLDRSRVTFQKKRDILVLHIGGFDIGLRSISCKTASFLRKQHNKIHKWTDTQDYDLGRDAGKRKWTYKLQDEMYVRCCKLGNKRKAGNCQRP